MIRYILLGAFFALGGVAAHAQTPQQTVLGYQSITGCSGVTIPCWIPYGATLPTGAAPVPVTPGPAAVSSITTGGTAVNALIAGSIKTGCDLLNAPTATEPLFFSLVGTASTTLGGGTMELVPGQAYHCPSGMTTALSVNAATAGHFFGAMSY